MTETTRELKPSGEYLFFVHIDQNGGLIILRFSISRYTGLACTLVLTARAEDERKIQKIDSLIKAEDEVKSRRDPSKIFLF